MKENELNDALLELVNGGVLKEEAIEELKQGILLSKAFKKDKFDYMRFVDNYFKTHPYFFSTDDSKEDYDKLMQLILDIYDTYEG